MPEMLSIKLVLNSEYTCKSVREHLGRSFHLFAAYESCVKGGSEAGVGTGPALTEGLSDDVTKDSCTGQHNRAYRSDP